MQNTDMNKIVGTHNILFVCIDSLRYDVAHRAEKEGATPVLNRHGRWRKCQAPGNFTYPSHQAMFAGFLPVDTAVTDMKQREKLFFSPDSGVGRKAPEGAFVFSRPTWVQELADRGYETHCIGGVSFFDKRTPLGSVMPSYFQHSHWQPSFSCKVKDSAANQVDYAIKILRQADPAKKLMIYLNISAIHYPNYFYLDGTKEGHTSQKKDSTEAHMEALKYVDAQLGRLFDAFALRGDTFVICCSDHGTCYGEDGVWYHGVNHPIVNTVPYKHFILTPYRQYMYSYPHKTAYRELNGISFDGVSAELAGGENSLYFHIPFCQSKCGYCNLFSVAGISGQTPIMEDYVDAMERQATQYADAMPPGVAFRDLTLGGGTPLILPESLLERIFCMAEKQFGFRPGEIPVIVETSPNQTDRQKLLLLKKYGVTRISIGVQSFLESELKTLCRFHSAERAARALACIRDVGFDCVNMDIIYGIPGQTRESLLSSLQKALEYKPDELFVYPLYVKAGTHLAKSGVMRKPDAVDLYRCARDFLLEHGYRQDSMRRFVRTGTDGQTAHSSDTSLSLCGFGNTVSVGCGGRSYIGNLHFCTPYGVGAGYCLDRLRDYISTKDHLAVTHGYLLNEKERKRRYAVRHILFGKGIMRSDYSSHFGRDVLEDFQMIQKWSSDGYVTITEDFITLTQEGVLLSDYLGPWFISDEVAERMEQWNR